MANDLACKGLDKIEKTLPILHKPSDQVLHNICLNVKVGMKRKLRLSFLSYCDLYPSGTWFVYQELIGSFALAFAQISSEWLSKICYKAAVARQWCHYSAPFSSVQFNNCVKFIYYETSSVRRLAAQLKTVVLLFSSSQFNVDLAQKQCWCCNICELWTN